MNVNAITSKLIEKDRHPNSNSEIRGKCKDRWPEKKCGQGEQHTVQAFHQWRDDSSSQKNQEWKGTGPRPHCPRICHQLRGASMLNWLHEFFSHSLSTLCLPKIWRQADITAILKPDKAANDTKNYRPIPLLCVPLKLVERLLLTRLEPTINPQLPHEQAGFHHGCSTTDQATLFTDDIETGFKIATKVSVVLMDLTAAMTQCGYGDSTWNCYACCLTPTWSFSSWSYYQLELQITNKWQPSESTETSVELCATRVSTLANALQHIHQWHSSDLFQTIWLHQWPHLVDGKRELDVSGEHPQQGHDAAPQLPPALVPDIEHSQNHSNRTPS